MREELRVVMVVQDLLRRADEFGVQLEVRDGGCVSLTALHRPPNAFLSELQNRKFQVVTYLAEHRRDVLDVPDVWAAAVAFERAVSAFIAQYQVASSSWHCDWCGRGPTADAAVLPVPIVGGDRVRLHAECWPSWHRRRRADAPAALRWFGIPVPVAAQQPGRDTAAERRCQVGMRIAADQRAEPPASEAS
jgi:hypothetical protein